MSINRSFFYNGKNSIAGDSVSNFTLSTFALATITSDMAVNKVVCIDMLLWTFSVFNYGSVLGRITCFVDKQSGPAYNLGSVTSVMINNSSGVANATDIFGSGFSGIVVSISSGNLLAKSIIKTLNIDLWTEYSCCLQT